MNGRLLITNYCFESTSAIFKLFQSRVPYMKELPAIVIFI